MADEHHGVFQVRMQLRLQIPRVMMNLGRFIFCYEVGHLFM